MGVLDNVKVAVISTDRFEDSELTSPVEAVKAEGAQVTVISTEAGTITGKNGTEVAVDMTSEQAQNEEFDALILPGGTNNADHIRMDEAAVAIVRKLNEANKPIAAICHGGWILTDANAVLGKTMTSYPSLKTDLQNAGATWVDEEVRVDENLITSRTPKDLEAFNKALIEQFAAK